VHAYGEEFGEEEAYFIFGVGVGVGVGIGIVACGSGGT